MIRTTILPLAVALAAVLPWCAIAQVAAPRETVRYTDLDINTHAGAARLMNRLYLAADHLCGGAPASTMEVGAWKEYRACSSETIANTVRLINAPRLTAMLEERKTPLELARR